VNVEGAQRAHEAVDEAIHALLREQHVRLGQDGHAGDGQRRFTLQIFFFNFYTCNQDAKIGFSILFLLT
jgi:hypothetical protein